MIDEKKYAAEIAYFRIRMGSVGDATPEKIRELVRQSDFPEIKGSPRLAEGMARYLESFYVVRQQAGVIIQKHEHKPWWADLRGSEGFDSHYWLRFREYMRTEKAMPQEVAATLDYDTNEILDRLGNPRDDGDWQKRGMVLGHVQSGKTTNYAALICKAADAGYRVVILLSGTSNLLRAQTQRRIDESFIGRNTGLHGIGAARSRIVGVGNYSPRNGRPSPAYATSVDGDFRRDMVPGFGVDIKNLNEPIIFVVKKNASVLSNLGDWLRTYYPDGGINAPLLLIDDEADNASINTRQSPDEFTRINGEIRRILSLFRRGSYVGYTATPFANIFIMPDSQDEMIGADLFPSDFIMALDPPSNYIGPSRVFAGDSDEKMLRRIDDYHEAFPAKHKKDHIVSELPESLRRAVRLFVLCRAIMAAYEQSGHSTMMVNVSHYNDVQEAVKGLIHDYLGKLQNAIRLHSQSEGGESSNHMEDMRRDFDKEYAAGEYDWAKVRAHLSTAGGMDVVAVNMRGDALDYERYREHGRHIIAVGGFALSRWLTLEGLRISYLARNAGAYDTLVQMGRWFGYREGYEDVCRVFMPAEVAERYAFVTGAMEELRGDVKRMNSLRETPRDFGLKVRKDPAAVVMRITARNKMHSAEVIRYAADFGGKNAEAHTIFGSVEENAKNYSHVRAFTKGLGEPTSPPADKHRHHLFWRNIPCRDVLNFMRGFKLPNKNEHFIVIGGTPSTPQTLVSEFIGDREDEYSLWDVCLPVNSRAGKAPRSVEVAGRKVQLRERKQGVVRDDRFYRIASKRIADRADAAIGLTQEQLEELEHSKDPGKEISDAAFNQKRKRPLLILHLFDAHKRDKDIPHFGGDPAVSFGVCFPLSSVPAEEKKYAANIVAQQQQFLDFDNDEYEEDE